MLTARRADLAAAVRLVTLGLPRARGHA